jgi:membrane protease YdiL (CAAX protease family)
VRRDAGALAFALLYPAIMAWLYFVALAGEGGRPNPALMAVFAAGKVVQFAFPAVYVWLYERQRLRLTFPGTRGLAAGLAFGLLVAAGILGLYEVWLSRSPLAAPTAERIHGKLQEFGCATPARFVALALFIAVGHSLLEEYYWRWFVFGWLRRYLALPWAVLVASAGFMAHHVIVLAVYFPGRLELALLFSLGVAIGGAFWAVLYEKSGSLLAPWASHLLIDLAVMAVGFELVSQYW